MKFSPTLHPVNSETCAFTLFFPQFIVLNGIESLVEQLHRVPDVTLHTRRLVSLSHFDADIFWHLSGWN